MTKHILVIEDDIPFRKLLSTILEKEGYRVTTAADGVEGCLRFKHEPPDLVITDIFMPEKEGFETIVEIRESDPNVKIIAISGGGQINAKDMVSFALDFGANEVMFKPIQPSKLTELINKLFSE